MQRPGSDVSQGKRFAWGIAVATALIVVAITALLTASIIKIRQDALDQARLRASHLSAALEEDMQGVLDTAAVASEFVKRSVESEGDAAPLAEFKQAISKYLPGLINISVIGPEGRLVATSGDVAASPADFSQFEFFVANRDSTGSGFRLGKPAAGPIPERVIIPVTQRLQNKDGGFAGVLLFSIDTARGIAMYRRVDLGNNGSIMIVYTDGTIFAGYSLPRGIDPSLIGAPIGDHVAGRLQGASSASYIAASPIDGIERIYSWRKLEDFPLIALVGLGKSEALRGANQQAILLSALGIFAVGLLLALTAMLGREISRRIKQALALEAQRHKLKEMNAECRSAKQQAEQANQSKSFFLANIGHELCTPLTGIIGFAEIIRDKVFGNDPERYAGYASDIYGAATHLLELIRNLLDWSKIEAGKFELHERVLDLNQIADECLHLVRGQAENRDVELTACLEAVPISLCADETALKQIFLNLLSNAIKFTPRGGSVWLGHTLDADGALTLSVEDSGIGMTEDEIGQALEPFGQVQSALLSHRDGTGLGLPLAAQLMELHSGALTVESHPGQGTTVTVRFPAWRVNPDNNPGSLKPPEKEHRPSSAKKVISSKLKH